MPPKSIGRWIPDNEATHCLGCGVKFSMLKKKHHCRDCGRIFCSTCASKERVIPQLHPKEKQRVCGECFESFVTRGVNGADALRQGVADAVAPAVAADTTSQDDQRTASLPPSSEATMEEQEPAVIPPPSATVLSEDETAELSPQHQDSGMEKTEAIEPPNQEAHEPTNSAATPEQAALQDATPIDAVEGKDESDEDVVERVPEGSPVPAEPKHEPKPTEEVQHSEGSSEKECPATSSTPQEDADSATTSRVVHHQDPIPSESTAPTPNVEEPAAAEEAPKQKDLPEVSEPGPTTEKEGTTTTKEEEHATPPPQEPLPTEGSEKNPHDEAPPKDAPQQPTEQPSKATPEPHQEQTEATIDETTSEEKANPETSPHAAEQDSPHEAKEVKNEDTTAAALPPPTSTGRESSQQEVKTATPKTEEEELEEIEAQLCAKGGWMVKPRSEKTGFFGKFRNVNDVWKKRYFKIDSAAGEILYGENASTLNNKLVIKKLKDIDHMGAQEVLADGCPRYASEYCMRIVTDDKVYKFAAATEEQFHLVYNLIRRRLGLPAEKAKKRDKRGSTVKSDGVPAEATAAVIRVQKEEREDNERVAHEAATKKKQEQENEAAAAKKAEEEAAAAAAAEEEARLAAEAEASRLRAKSRFTFRHDDDDSD